MTRKHRICLVTPGHIASTPRLVREADALQAAGFGVQVISCRHFAPADELDASLLRSAPWSCTRVDIERGPWATVRKLLRRLARPLAGLAPRSLSLAARIQNASSLRLAAAAASVEADLYLGHCAAGLVAAGIAARRRKRLLGFDAEDFHDGETADAAADPRLAAALRLIQSRLLPECRHLTAASPLIARRYADTYGIEPVVVLNTFSRRDAPPRPIRAEAIGGSRPARLYWFSQTIGPGRGLEAVLRAMGLMRVPAELRLRGFVSEAYRRRLEAIASRAGTYHPPVFLPPAPPEEMVRLAAVEDLGLSTEESHPLNRDLCLTNKIFAYLLAGIPQLLSSTSAQRALAPDLGGAALLGDLESPADIAQKLDAFLDDRERIQRARDTAWQLAQSRYCWEIEQDRFLESVNRALR